MLLMKKFLHSPLTGLGCLFGIFIGIYFLFTVLLPLITNIQKRGISFQDIREASQGAAQTFSQLQNRMGQVPTPRKTILMSEYAVDNICCGQGEHHSTWPIVTKLYESKLTKDEVREFYKSYQVDLYFVDEIIEMYPDRRVNIPCYPFNLLTGHIIPEEIPKDKNLYIITGSGSYTPSNPKIVYCD